MRKQYIWNINKIGKEGEPWAIMTTFCMHVVIGWVIHLSKYVYKLMLQHQFGTCIKWSM